ncbi:MAG: hypothetical protein DMF74_11215 [Acidobacteria bacterium]|nr:MAG: hypothetical protein DMF74_11215 [Acidobacteriota bacterium]
MLGLLDCGTRLLRVIHGRDARATFSNCTSTSVLRLLDLVFQGWLLGCRYKKVKFSEVTI